MTDDETRRRLVAFAAALLVLAAAIAFITLRPDPQAISSADADTPSASTSESRDIELDSAASAEVDATSDSGTANDATAEDTASTAASSEESSTAAVPDEASDEPVTEAIPSIPRTQVSLAPLEGLINGRITYVADGAPAEGVSVVLLASDESGTIGETVSSGVTDDQGGYGFDVDDGCYVAIFTAPEGFAFPGVGDVLNGPPVCVTADSPFTVGASLEAN